MAESFMDSRVMRELAIPATSSSSLRPGELPVGARAAVIALQVSSADRSGIDRNRRAMTVMKCAPYELVRPLRRGRLPSAVRDQAQPAYQMCTQSLPLSEPSDHPGRRRPSRPLPNVHLATGA